MIGLEHKSNNFLTDFDAGVTGPDLNIDGAVLDADVEYTFEMTTTNFLGASDYDSMDVSRSAVATPEVTIIPNGIDTSNVLVSERYV